MREKSIEIEPYFTSLDEAIAREQGLIADGFAPIAGVLISEASYKPGSVTADFILSFDSKCKKHLKSGALIGPYIIDGELKTGLKLWMQEAYVYY